MLFVVQVHKKRFFLKGKSTHFIHRDVHGRRPLFFLGFLNYLQRSFLLFLNDPQNPFSHLFDNRTWRTILLRLLESHV